MKRRLFNLAAGLSLLMSVCTAREWINSAAEPKEIIWKRDGRSFYRLFTGDGAYLFEVRERPIIRALVTTSPVVSVSYMHVRPIVRVRYWLVIVLTMCLPTVWLVRRWRVGVLPGRCRSCGYDLRESPDRCPECGTAKIAGDAEG
jgi:hypothetical protein